MPIVGRGGAGVDTSAAAKGWPIVPHPTCEAGCIYPGFCLGRGHSLGCT